jgi:hypothetical protein
MEEGPEHFRAFIWREIASLAGIPVLAFMLWLAPVTSSWSTLQWLLLAGAGAVALAAYFANALRKADITLDDEGLTLWRGRIRRTYAWADLKTVRQIGRYRVRMCFNGEEHEHVAVDVLTPEAFLEAVVDWHQETIGGELKVNAPPEAETNAAA